jgi:Zn-dependent protease
VKSPPWAFFALAVGGIVLLFVTILVHEFGHGLTARRYGGEIDYILLWPFGGLCVHSLPQQSLRISQKLWRDWWVTFNGPATHFLQIPFWAVAIWLLYSSYGFRYTTNDLLADLNPLEPVKSLGRHPEVLLLGWGAFVAAQLCTTAIEVNVMLFLFTVFFPLYPLDGSKLLVTGLQLCGMRTKSAARTFIWVSGVCAVLVLVLMVYGRYVEKMSYGITLSVLLSLGIGMMGQTLELYELGRKRLLHTHPLFSHMPTRTRRVRDTENGRLDLFLEKTFDESETENERAHYEELPGGPARYGRVAGAVQILPNGEIVRNPPVGAVVPRGGGQFGALPRQIIVPR